MSGPSSIFCELLIQAPCSLSAKLGSLLRDNNHPLRSSLQHFIVDLLLEVCSSLNQSADTKLHTFENQHGRLFNPENAEKERIYSLHGDCVVWLRRGDWRCREPQASYTLLFYLALLGMY